MKRLWLAIAIYLAALLTYFPVLSWKIAGSVLDDEKGENSDRSDGRDAT